eukprot:2076034-Rhodomonas_salina.1
MPGLLRLRGGERERKKEKGGRKRNDDFGDMEQTLTREMKDDDTSEQDEATSKVKTRTAKKAARKSLESVFVSGGSRGGKEEREGEGGEHPPRWSHKHKKGVSDEEDDGDCQRGKKLKQSAKKKPQHVDMDDRETQPPRHSSTPADTSTAAPTAGTANDTKEEGGSVSEGDEYLDYFKYRLKWSFDRSPTLPPCARAPRCPVLTWRMHQGGDYPGRETPRPYQRSTPRCDVLT